MKNPNHNLNDNSVPQSPVKGMVTEKKKPEANQTQNVVKQTGRSQKRDQLS